MKPSLEEAMARLREEIAAADANLQVGPDEGWAILLPKEYGEVLLAALVERGLK